MIDTQELKRTFDLINYVSSIVQPKRVTNTWLQAPCPLKCNCGRDRFTVKRFDDGSYGWMCRECSPNRKYRDSIAFVMEYRNCSFNDAIEHMSNGTIENNPKSLPPSPKKKPTKRRYVSKSNILVEYPYHDENGNLVFVKARTDSTDKSYKYTIYHYDKGECWFGSNGMDGKYLYNHHLIADADAIFVVEGEKDCDRLMSELGDLSNRYVVTTNCNGSMNIEGWQNTQDFYCEFSNEQRNLFAGKRVYIIPDNDEVGYNKADRLEAKLLKDGHRMVWIVDICKDMPVGADISDWFNDGNTIQHLSDVVRSIRTGEKIEVNPSYYDSIKIDLQAQKDTVKTLATILRLSSVNTIERFSIVPVNLGDEWLYGIPFVDKSNDVFNIEYRSSISGSIINYETNKFGLFRFQKKRANKLIVMKNTLDAIDLDNQIGQIDGYEIVGLPNKITANIVHELQIHDTYLFCDPIDNVFAKNVLNYGNIKKYPLTITQDLFLQILNTRPY